MAITTNKVLHPKVNGVYQAHDTDLKIHLDNPTQHDVIVTSINKKKNTARVKTITSLETTIVKDDGKGNKTRRRVFTNSKLRDVRIGNILPIPKRQLHSKHYSGINHNGITISLNKLYYKEPNDRTKFPNRYADLIHRK